jgi:hypothetical protein
MSRADSNRRTRRARPRRSPAGAIGRTLAVLFICAGIASLGLLAGGDHPEAVARRWQDPMAGYYPGGMPRYPGVKELPASPATRVGGAKVRMSYFDTEDEPAKVARFYRRYWRERQYFVRDDVTHVGGAVSAVDVENSQIYQALISAQGDRAMVFPSVTRFPMRALNTKKIEPVVPLFPDSRAVLSLETEGDQGATATVVMSVNDGGLTDNLAHYRRELQAAGFTVESKSTDRQKKAAPQQRVLLYRKGTQEVTVSLSLLGGERVRVHIMMVGA